MSSLIALPFRPVINQNGEFEAGATMTVYKRGTTTLEPLFENPERTIPVNNPVTADGYGVFPPVYWNDAQAIRLLIEESNGTVLFDVDPYISTVFDAEAILDQAVAQTTAATEQASIASSAAVSAAASEATVQALLGPNYASTAAGLAATTNGQFFAVVSGDVISIYLNNAGSAVLQRSILSATTVQAALDAKANLTHSHVIADVTGLQTALDAKAPIADPNFSGTAQYGGIEIGYRDVVRRTTTNTAVVGDRGGCIVLGANITIPASVYSAGAAVSFYNNTSGSLTLIQGSGLTLRLAGTNTTGNRTLAQRGMANIWFNSATEGIISGPGVS